LTSIKPFFGLLVILFAVKSRWAALATTAATAFICVLIGIATLGWPVFDSWVRAGSITWTGHIFNASVFGFLSRLLTNHELAVWMLAPSTNAPILANTLWVILLVGILAFSACAIWRQPAKAREAYDRSRLAIDRMFAVTMSAALLIFPVAWIYYHFFLAGPFIALCSDHEWRKGLGWRKMLLAGAAACFMFSPGALTLGQPHGWATASVGSAYFWGSLGLWTCALAGPESHS
jgi:Glycosyltransferase family 87